MPVFNSNSQRLRKLTFDSKHTRIRLRLWNDMTPPKREKCGISSLLATQIHRDKAQKARKQRGSNMQLIQTNRDTMKIQIRIAC